MSNIEKATTTNTALAAFVEQLETAKEIAALVKESAYGKLFEVFVPDPNDETKQIKVIIKLASFKKAKKGLLK